VYTAKSRLEKHILIHVYQEAYQHTYTLPKQKSKRNHPLQVGRNWQPPRFLIISQLQFWKGISRPGLEPATGGLVSVGASQVCHTTR
jgi:hypothetical protein